MLGWWFLLVLFVVAAIPLSYACGRRQSAEPSQRSEGATSPEEYDRRARWYHDERRLKEASADYAEVLRLDPPREPTEEELALIRRFTPCLYVTPSEPFPLVDFAAIMHPDKPIISYHMFWDDDIDFPSDNDPCDHEEVWVEYDPKTRDVQEVYTYYHGRILHTREAVEDARQHGGRPRINVQWGKHGSLPVGWEKMLGTAIYQDMRRTYRRLHTEGHRELNHPLARNWPRTFEGSWEDFIDFSKSVEPLELLDAKGMVMVSRWTNAVIDQYFLRYNFRGKKEWPWEK